MDAWSKTWMSAIDVEKLTPYPIQLANCDRLEKNDAVYIFDEVGCGKTISSGLMALHYLCHHRASVEKCRQQEKQTVLVITTNSMKVSGQFLNDWAEKLPFEALGFRPKWNLEFRYDVRLCNNLHSDLQCISPQYRYGLVIIDEAHLFLNEEARRYRDLVANVRAEKVVFLTATPIKRNARDDLERYVKIAQSITEKPLKESTADLLNRVTVRADGKDLICTRFDLGSPVTRYFKDVISALRKEKFQKTEGVRAMAHIWPYYAGGMGVGVREEKKKRAMLEGIEKALGEDRASRFILFVRYKDEDSPQGAPAIAAFLQANHWREWPSGQSVPRDGERYYAVVTGDTGDLSRFQEEEDHNSLPHVLILTYQKADAGVNLPGFNYVVNYHIPDNPAALEQRFGRVDRLKGQHHPQIHACYLVDPDFDLSDTNSRNFHNAQALYMKELLPVIPVRNTLITDVSIRVYREKQAWLEHTKERIRLCIKGEYGDRQLQALLEGRTDEVQPELCSFAQDEEIAKAITLIGEIHATPAEKIQWLRNKLNSVLNQFRSLDAQTLAHWEEIILATGKGREAGEDGRIGDSIFYKDDKGDLCCLSFKDCAQQIQNCGQYQGYLKMPELPG